MTQGNQFIFLLFWSEWTKGSFRYANAMLLYHTDHWGRIKDSCHAVAANARPAGNLGSIFVGKRGWVISLSTARPVETPSECLFEGIRLATREVNISANNRYASGFEYPRVPRSHRESGHLGDDQPYNGTILELEPVTEDFNGDGCEPFAGAREARTVASESKRPIVRHPASNVRKKPSEG